MLTKEDKKWIKNQIGSTIDKSENRIMQAMESIANTIIKEVNSNIDKLRIDTKAVLDNHERRLGKLEDRAFS